MIRVVSSPEPDAVLGRDYDVPGRITVALLNRILPDLKGSEEGKTDFYLCGPDGFAQSLYDKLHAAGASQRSIIKTFQKLMQLIIFAKLCLVADFIVFLKNKNS